MSLFKHLLYIKVKNYKWSFLIQIKLDIVNNNKYLLSSLKKKCLIGTFLPYNLTLDISLRSR